MSFRVLGLEPEPFSRYFAMSDDELRMHGAVRVIADADHLPCRVSLAHAAAGEELLLINYEHQPADSPYNHATPSTWGTIRSAPSTRWTSFPKWSCRAW